MSLADENMHSASPMATGRLTDQPISRGAVFAIVVLLGFSYAFNGMDRQVFPSLLGPIRLHYGLTLAEGGLLSNAFTVNIAIFGALSGWFMGRFGRKATLVGGLIAYSIFTALTPFATSFTDLVLYRAMTGAGEALHIAAIFAMLGAYFGPRRGVFMGINNSFFGIGAFLGPVIGTHLFQTSGTWGLPFLVFGAAGVASALTVAAVVPHRFAAAVDTEKVRGDRVAVGAMAFVNRNSVSCVIVFTLVGCSFFAYTALYSTYLRTVLNYGITDAGAAFGMFGIGALTGVVNGWLSERLKNIGLLAALTLLAVDGYAMFHNVGSLWEQSLMSFVFGALVSGYLFPGIIALMQRCVAAEQIGHAMSILLFCFYLPGLGVGYGFGKLIETVGWNVASTLAVAVPPALALAVNAFHDPRKVRGAA